EFNPAQVVFKSCQLILNLRRGYRLGFLQFGCKLRPGSSRDHRHELIEFRGPDGLMMESGGQPTLDFRSWISGGSHHIEIAQVIIRPVQNFQDRQPATFIQKLDALPHDKASTRSAVIAETPEKTFDQLTVSIT